MLINFENLTFFKQNFSAKTKYTKVVTYKDKKKMLAHKIIVPKNVWYLVEAVSQNLRKFANLLHSMLREDLNKKSEIREITFLRIKRIIFLKG